MGVLQEIIRETTAENGDVPRMLRLCLLLGKRLGHMPLTNLVQHELEGSPEEPFSLPLPKDTRLQRIAAALIAAPADTRDLAQWAEWSAVSMRTLSRLVGKAAC